MTVNMVSLLINSVLTSGFSVQNHHLPYSVVKETETESG